MQKKRNIFTVLGILPEPGGYALAKFSRGFPQKSYKDWVRELTQKGAEKFYNTYYFNYGHSSIADLAHVTVIMENISTAARMTVIDEPLMDVQESSTRYVDYSQPHFVTPNELRGKKLEKQYQEACEYLFERYRHYLEKMIDFLGNKYAKSKPKNMDDKQARRILTARAFDEARYFLPSSFQTGLGFIVNARTLEKMIGRLLSSELEECKQIGKELKEAVKNKKAFSPYIKKFEKPSAPTLVRYADENQYLKSRYKNLRKFARENVEPYLGKPDDKRGVKLYWPTDDEIDLAVTLLYRAMPHSYEQIKTEIQKWPKRKVGKLIALAYEGKGRHDPLIKELATGRLTYDTCLDNGAFRDLHRHRNMIHIFKNLTGEHGVDVPHEVSLDQKLSQEFRKDLLKVWPIAKKMNKIKYGLGEYVLPLATRRRVLMRLDPRQLQYMTELRTTPKGNWSYRDIAWKMYLEYKKYFPRRAKHFQLANPETTDFWRR